uniref:PNPLA domain-containing protein n=1 Tax=Setaria digitata TaxID=48799 RepID=A0A915PW14_9BILA
MPPCGVRIVNLNPERIQKASLSLSGCGFLCIYHAGVCAAIKEYAPQLLRNQISGASAGSIIAAGVACNVCISKATSFFLSVVSEARSYTFGALNRDFDLLKLVRIKLNTILPSNAHELCTGRLRISVTRFRDMKNVILDDFRTKDELIDAVCCSCFIPVYGGFVYPTFRDEIYIDGGASDNQPIIDMNTITVSPFSGESDICPTDEESASLFEWNFAGTSIRLTANNLYRAAVCLFPPSTEECASMCRNGFKDALKFLISNGLASDAICLSMEADLSTNINRNNEGIAETTSNSALYRAMLLQSHAARLSQEGEKTSEYIDFFLIAESAELPHSMQSAFDEAMKKSYFLDYIRSFRVVRLAKFVTLPLTAGYQLLKFCQCLSAWLAARITKRITDDWHSMRVKHIIDFILNEIHTQGVKLSARLSQQLTITEVELSVARQQPIFYEQLYDINLSFEGIKEHETLRSIDRLLSKTLLSSAKVDSAAAIPMSKVSLPFGSVVSLKERNVVENDKGLSQITEETTKCDAALKFYYKSRSNKLRVCEIFGVDHPGNQYRCHPTRDD